MFVVQNNLPATGFSGKWQGLQNGKNLTSIKPFLRESFLGSTLREYRSRLPLIPFLPKGSLSVKTRRDYDICLSFYLSNRGELQKLVIGSRTETRIIAENINYRSDKEREKEMSQPRFYSFKKNLAEEILKEFPGEESVLIFPTERSKKAASKFYQQSRNFSDKLFQTMEEFKEAIFVGDLPLLREERRNIALYHSLNSEQKRELKIENYFQFIRFAADFFKFWEEFAEEKIAAERCLETLEESGDEILDWQERTFRLLIAIREGYRTLLKKKGWTDTIFLYNEEHLTLDFYKTRKSFVFINQHYYTKLENSLLKTLQRQGFEVTVCYQLAESFVDKENNCLIDKPLFQVFDPADHRTERIEIFIAQNDFSLYGKCLEILQKDPGIKDIFDSRFHQSAYPRFLSPQYFSGVDAEPLLNSRVAVFLFSLIELMENIIREERKGRDLIPLTTLKKILSDPVFFSCFNPDHTLQERVMGILDDYQRNNRHCFDLDPGSLTLKEQEILTERVPGERETIAALQGIITKISHLLNNLTEIDSIGKFIALIDSENGLALQNIFSEEEKKFSNIQETFYQKLADFANIEALELIDNQVFWNEGGVISRFSTCLGILKLFLLYLRPARGKWFYDIDRNRRDISSPMDSRNLSFDNVAILNVTEGVLPASQSTPFLFTEAQRKKLGLKTYEDIRCWEKYYFFRLLLNSRNVYLFAQRNSSRNVEISSFIEELKLLFKDLQPVIFSEKVLAEGGEFVPDSGYRDFYTQVLNPDETYRTDKETLKDLSFYTIPFDKGVDLPGNKLRLSFSSYRVLQNSPFSFFLKYIAGIKEEFLYQPFSPQLLGTITHEIIEQLWQIIRSTNGADLSGSLDELPQQVSGILDNNRDNLLRSDKFYYKIPHNYSYQYFRSVFLPIVEEGIVRFFFDLRKLLGEQNSAAAFRTEVYQKNRTFPLPAGIEPEVLFSGIADLIIEEGDNTPAGKFQRIFDYKTGNLNDKKGLVTQLLFYEFLFYYLEFNTTNSFSGLIDLLSGPERIKSYMYSLSERKMLELAEFYARSSKRELAEKFIAELVTNISGLYNQGYTGLTARNAFCLYPEIIRTDLLKKHIAVSHLDMTERGE